jgi:hypothetical protein
MNLTLVTPAPGAMTTKELGVRVSFGQSWQFNGSHLHQIFDRRVNSFISRFAA